jgi:ligand-binding sensor domain-containing protein
LIAEEGQNPVAYAYNDRLPPGSGVNGLVIDVDGNLFVTDNTQLRKISTDGSVTLLATGFKFARGLAEKDGCILVAEFSDGITGSLYRVCPESKPICVNVTANPNILWPPNHKM